METSCQVETHRSLLQMLQTISFNSPSEGNRMSASISIRGKRKYLQWKHSNWIFDYKAVLPQGVSPLGSVWVYNLLSMLPVEKFNYFTNMSCKISWCLNSKTIILHCHYSSQSRKKYIDATLIAELGWEREKIHNSYIDQSDQYTVAVLWAIELTSPWILIEILRCSCLGQGQPVNHIEITVQNVQMWQYKNKSVWIESI